ncbi:multiprotein-bridging factor 1 family protein [Streptomyces buecherae]|uniref:multiprotein-bridging factor 1 family protein n=1 Tax=Streptomyces buecherae TaxID=2763006 RepID=UPI00378C493F
MNHELRAVRTAMRLSQEEMARRIRKMGDELGEPNDCTANRVKRWESGEVNYPRRQYVRALEAVTGRPIETLGFAFTPRHGRLSDAMAGGSVVRIAEGTPTIGGVTMQATPHLTGVWESRCTYHSSGRGTELLDLAHVVVVQSGSRLSVRSIEGSTTEAAEITMSLEIRGHVVTGTWEEKTSESSYYRGAVFFGAIQMQVEASASRMIGKWVGFGRDFDVNVGPWELVLRAPSTRDVERWAHLPSAGR